MGEWLVRFLLARLREPSTWRGIVGLLTALGLTLRPDLAEAIIALGMALAGGIAVVTPDRVRDDDRRVLDRWESGYLPTADHPTDYPADGESRRTGREDLERWGGG